MKYHENDYYKKKRRIEWNREHQAGGFRCSHCKIWVSINDFMGTANRNHCSHCLWSKHVDEKKGDRRQECHGGMKPVGLTFKHEGYGRQGELMLIHQCAECARVSINRVAGDDDPMKILAVFEASCAIGGTLSGELTNLDITWLEHSDQKEVKVQLFGKR